MSRARKGFGMDSISFPSLASNEILACFDERGISRRLWLSPSISRTHTRTLTHTLAPPHVPRLRGASARRPLPRAKFDTVSKGPLSVELLPSALPGIIMRSRSSRQKSFPFFPGEIDGWNVWRELDLEREKRLHSLPRRFVRSLPSPSKNASYLLFASRVPLLEEASPPLLDLSCCQCRSLLTLFPLT